MRTVPRNNNVCILNHFIFVYPDCLSQFYVEKKNALTQKYRYEVAKEDPQARSVGDRAVEDGSQS